jgi:predicted NAD/FAD-binding protein
MTFGISRDAGAFEWSGTSGSALFAQPENALKPSFWRMIFDIFRFNQFALDLLSAAPGLPSASITTETSIGQYLEQEGYSDAFRDDYLIPMTACVWSTGADKCALEFPAMTLIRFMWNHHLLSTISERPPWLTIQGGSRRYIDAVIEGCKEAHVHLSTPVKSLTRRDGRVELELGGGGGTTIETFDEVILACHGDQARELIGASATVEEKDILAAFETTPNTAYLHSDLSLMPERRAAWSAWNYLTIIRCSANSLVDLQYEHSSSPPCVRLLRHSCHTESRGATFTVYYTSSIQLSAPSVQCAHDCCPEPTRKDSRQERCLVHRRLDRLRLP